MELKLISTISGKEYNFSCLEEVSDNNEPLEVYLPGLERARIKTGEKIWERFADFLPFPVSENISLGEGNTPLIAADSKLKKYTGLDNLFLKDETINPTGSFKDRGSLLVTAMSRKMNESVTATISTGNMGSSISAYGKKAGLKVIVFIPDSTPEEKIQLMCQFDPYIIKIKAPDYSKMKKKILAMASELNLRIVSGNGPIRVEGYKLTAFEMFEQMMGEVPDYIAVPTSACGHIRGIFKGYLELFRSGYIRKLPKMIIVQAENNSPIVSAIKQGRNETIPFIYFKTIAHAITSGDPFGGNELIGKAGKFNWLAEDVTEDEIVKAQKVLNDSGYLVEPASATVLPAVRKLQETGKIEADAKVVLILTGSAEKHIRETLQIQTRIISCNLQDVKGQIRKILLKNSQDEA
ncbi:threonine synthase [Candidatus Cloacimonadota bacterium]